MGRTRSWIAAALVAGSIGLGGCPQQAPSQVTYDGVLKLLGQCDAFEMGTAEPQTLFGKPEASGVEMCTWKSQQVGHPVKCAIAGRVYANGSVQTGYGVWSCLRQDIVSSSHNGWALCCPLTP